MSDSADRAEVDLAIRQALAATGIGLTDSIETVRRKLNAAFLPYVDARELHRRISNFRKLNFRELSYEDVSHAVRDVIMFDTPGGKQAAITWQYSQYSAGTRFYRARIIPKDDRTIPLQSMSTVRDCWEPPKESVRVGRLNRENEPLLYTCPGDPSVAIDELKIADGERFSLIVHEAVEDVNVTIIGGQPDTESLGDVDALKVEMLQGFLRDEFTRDVGEGTEYLYRISEIIANDYFDMPPELHDAWCYPSVADKDKFNVAFRPHTRTKLRLIGVQIAKVYRLQDGSRLFRVDAVVKAKEGDEQLVYFSVGSPEQHEMFPEITEGMPDDFELARGRP